MQVFNRQKRTPICFYQKLIFTVKNHKRYRNGTYGTINGDFKYNTKKRFENINRCVQAIKNKSL